MKKAIYFSLALLFVLALALAAAGCVTKEAPAESPPVSSPPASASESATASPSPSPTEPPKTDPPTDPPTEPPETPLAEENPLAMPFDFVMLVLDEYYYLDNDPDSMGVMFLDGGKAVSTDGEEGTYTTEEGSRDINIFVDGEQTALLYIIDDSILLLDDSHDFYIRGGGTGYDGEETVPEGFDKILFSQYYFLDGDAMELSYYFYDDGDVDIGTPEEWVTGMYIIGGDYITIVLDKSVYTVLRVENTTELEDIRTTCIYALEGALDRELVTYEYYYMYADEESGSLWFDDDGNVDIEDEYGEISTATYYINGMDVTISFEGEEEVVTIANSYLLKTDDGFYFVRIP